MVKYEIRDIGLAEEGLQKIRWAKEHMPVLRSIEEEFRKTQPLKGLRGSLSIHLEAKTAYLSMVLAAGGAQMCVTGSNVLSTKDDVAAALAKSGIGVFAYHNGTPQEYERHVEMCLEHKPHFIIDDGADLVTTVHSKRPDLAECVLGGCEETTTGLIRLRAMEEEGVLKFPMVAVNDADCKHLFDNRYGTGQSVWDGIMRTTNLMINAKNVVIIGYGWCGKGIAQRASGLGARVIVTEIDPVKAIEAKMDGFDVMTMNEASVIGDIFVTATGGCDAISMEHMKLMKDGAILANAGHFAHEIDMESLEEAADEKRMSRDNIFGYRLGEKWIHVIAMGRLVNIAAADGHPAEIMDMSFAVQALSALYIVKNQGKLPNKVINVGKEIDDLVARRRLAAWGIEIDSLTEKQKKYLKSWQL